MGILKENTGLEECVNSATTDGTGTMSESLDLIVARRLLIMALWAEVKDKKKMLAVPRAARDRDYWKVEE